MRSLVLPLSLNVYVACHNGHEAALAMSSTFSVANELTIVIAWAAAAPLTVARSPSGCSLPCSEAGESSIGCGRDLPSKVTCVSIFETLMPDLGFKIMRWKAASFHLTV